MTLADALWFTSTPGAKNAAKGEADRASRNPKTTMVDAANTAMFAVAKFASSV